MTKRGIALSIAGLVVGAVLILLRSTMQQPTTVPGQHDSPASATPQRPEEHRPDSSLLEATPAASTIERINEIARQLTAANDPQTSRRLLAELRTFLDRLPPGVASGHVQTYLRTGNDAVTRLDVTVEAGGVLADASSLRVFLLDYLGRIDKPAAGRVAAEILSHYTTPDEWAVSLRNYAWANPGSKGEEYLQAKAHELLSNPEWIKNPTAGFLQAFDSIVYAKAASLTPQLTALIRDKNNRAVGHAAFLALDRLVIAEPASILSSLAAQPKLLETREQTRANLFARADIRDTAQRTFLERYLLDPRRNNEELQTFAAVYPNANFMISNNLLTTVSTPSREELATHDASALGVVNEWLRDPHFERLKPHLEIIRSRLETFVRPGN